MDSDNRIFGGKGSAPASDIKWPNGSPLVFLSSNDFLEKFSNRTNN